MTRPTEWTAADTIALVQHLTDECERAARHWRGYDNDPAALLAWAARIEGGFAPNGNNLAALHLESAAAAGRRYLAEAATPLSPAP